MGSSEVICLWDRMERLLWIIVLFWLSSKDEVKSNFRVKNILIFFLNSCRNLIIILLKEMWIINKWRNKLNISKDVFERIIDIFSKLGRLIFFKIVKNGCVG